MKFYLKAFAILIISNLVDSNEPATHGTNSEDIDRMCAASVKSKEKQFDELQSKFKELERNIRLKDSQLTQQIKLNVWLKDIIASKDELLNTLQNHKIANFQHDITLKNEIITEKNNIIKAKEAEVNAIKLKFDENYKELVSLKNQIQNKDNQITELNDEMNDEDFFITINTIKIKKLEDELFKCKSSPVISSCKNKSTNVYTIQAPGMDKFSVPCDSTMVGSGWMVIQRRIDGSVNFNRNWNEYRDGFGNLRGEFFIGLEKLHLLTKSQPHELYIHLMDFKNETRYAQYSHFEIGNEYENYKLKSIGNYSGTAGNTLIYHLNFSFSTPDRDNEIDEYNNCAKVFQSGWWFNNCYYCNLNGVYRGENATFSIISWILWKKQSPLKHVQIMIRPKI